MSLANQIAQSLRSMFSHANEERKVAFEQSAAVWWEAATSPEQELETTGNPWGQSSQNGATPERDLSVDPDVWGVPPIDEAEPATPLAGSPDNDPVWKKLSVIAPELLDAETRARVEPKIPDTPLNHEFEPWGDVNYAELEAWDEDPSADAPNLDTSLSPLHIESPPSFEGDTSMPAQPTTEELEGLHTPAIGFDDLKPLLEPEPESPPKKPAAKLSSDFDPAKYLNIVGASTSNPTVDGQPYGSQTYSGSGTEINTSQTSDGASVGEGEEAAPVLHRTWEKKKPVADPETARAMLRELSRIQD